MGDHALVVRRLASPGERFEGPPEGGHTVRNLALLVLCNRELNVTKHELVVYDDGLVVVRRRLLEVVHDEVDYL